MKNLKISGFCLFLLISSTSFAQTNQDRKKDYTHHNKTMDKSYEDWDSNHDKKLDEKEFKNTFEKMDSFKMWDTDSDKYITEKEWEKGLTVHGDKLEDKKIGSFEEWDKNDDDKIDKSEYIEGNFNMWDKDNNGYVDNTEFGECQKRKK